MSPRTGRPPVDQPKNIDVKCRFDEKQHAKLMAYCNAHNMTRTEAIRKAVDLLTDKDRNKK